MKGRSESSEAHQGRCPRCGTFPRSRDPSQVDTEATGRNTCLEGCRRDTVGSLSNHEDVSGREERERTHSRDTAERRSRGSIERASKGWTRRFARAQPARAPKTSSLRCDRSRGVEYRSLPPSRGRRPTAWPRQSEGASTRHSRRNVSPCEVPGTGDTARSRSPWARHEEHGRARASLRRSGKGFERDEAYGEERSRGGAGCEAR